MSKQRMSHMDALHKVAREQDVRPGFLLLDRIADQELHIAEQEKRIAELEAMVREYADTCSCVQMMLRDSPVRCMLCTKALALLQPEAGNEVGK